MATVFKVGKNFGQSVLAVECLNSALQLTLTASGSTKFNQSATTRMVIWDAAYNYPLEDLTREIVLASYVGSEVWNITRAQESTVAKTWTAGSKVANAFTYQDFVDFKSAINTAENDIDVIEGDITTIIAEINDHESRLDTIETGAPVAINVQYLNGFQDTDFLKIVDYQAAESQQVSIFQDQQSSTVNGANQIVANLFQERTINTTVVNNITGCSLNSNIITLGIGEYIIEWRCNIACIKGLSRLRNITDTSYYYGSTVMNQSASTTQGNSFGRADINIAATKTFKIEAVTSTAGTTASKPKHGRAHGIPTFINVYTDVKITRIT
jgi:hypothetical protein